MLKARAPAPTTVCRVILSALDYVMCVKLAISGPLRTCVKLLNRSNTSHGFSLSVVEEFIGTVSKYVVIQLTANDMASVVSSPF